MITVHRIADGEGFTMGFTIIIDTAESAKQFEQLVQRGANLWPDAQPEIKEFADLVTGEYKILQRYREQAKDKHAPGAKVPANMRKCLSCGYENVILANEHSFHCRNCNVEQLV